MNRSIFVFIVIFSFYVCSAQSSYNPDSISKTSSIAKDNNEFYNLFVQVKPEELNENVFKDVGTDWTCITSGNDSLFNSMTASFGGWGILFGKPATWCFLRSNRYTLELIRKHKKYTMSYFDAKYKDQLLLFGSKSGRNSNKMKETKLTHIITPNGSISYKEARLIIECELVEITTVNPNDFFDESAKKFVIDGYNDTKDYHKLVFGEIKGIWIRKEK